MIVELCQRVLNGKGMPDEWQTSVLVPIFKKRGGEIQIFNVFWYDST